MSQHQRRKPRKSHGHDEPVAAPAPSRGARWGMIAAIALLIAAAAMALYVEAARDPNVALLAPHQGARWITWPLDPGVSVRDGFYAEPTGRFARRFEVERVRPAALLVRAAGACSVVVNGRPVLEPAPGSDWKPPRRADLASVLRAGDNTVEITVAARYGPPCLWARIEGLDRPVATDTTWSFALDGMPPARATFADDTRLTDLNRSGIVPWRAFGGRLPALVAMFVVVLIAALSWQARRLPMPGPGVALVAALAGWAVLFAFNAARLGVWTGFDMPGHLAYIEHLLDHHALPPAREGWESHQPPIFYLLSALVLGTARAFTGGQGLWSLKIVPLLAGAGQIALAWLAARRLFARGSVAVAAAAVFAAIVPMNLYVSSYVTNEPLAGFTGGLVTLAALAVLARERPSTRDFLLLGGAMGLAVGTKVSGWVPVLVALAVVVVALAAERSGRARRIAGALGVMAAAGLVLGGWFYARNWIAYGTPVVSPWRGGIEYHWWQDPGFHTPGWFLHFGRVFAWPAFSAFYSFWDSVYATMWGDWLCGGLGAFGARPPWNYPWMATLLPLGLPIVALLLIGFAVAFARAARGDRQRLLLVGVTSALGYSLIELNLRMPYHGHAKAFFCLGALVAASLLFADGLMWALARSRGGARTAALAVFWAYVATFALAAGMSFLVRANDPQRHLHEAWRLERDDRLDDAARELAAAVQVEPDNGVAQGEYAHALALLGRMGEAGRHFAVAERLRPRDAEIATRYAGVLGELHRDDEAIAMLERALALDPANVQANLLYAQHLAVRGRNAEAAEQCRILLRVDPGNKEAERMLGVLERRL